MKRIPEEFIHYLWRYGLFEQFALTATDGSNIEILERGLPNFDSGPDFSRARIKIGEKLWVGNVEIHYKSSDWDAHGHQLDKAYNNVILHVVIHHDRDVRAQHGHIIPVLCLSPYLSIDHFKRYEKFINNKDWVPCERMTSHVDEFKWLALKERLAFERLSEKAHSTLMRLDNLIGDWEALCYQRLAGAFGSKVNSEPFEILAGRTSIQIAGKHHDDLELVQALYLGQAGYLGADELIQDDFTIRLNDKYRFLRQKYDLQPMNSIYWKRSRIRPSSSPQIRIAQFAKLIASCRSLLTLFLESDMVDIKTAFSISLDKYWNDHIGLGRSSKPAVKRVGESMKDRLVVNAVAPIRFAYGEYVNETRYKESALSLLIALRAEDNKIVRGWSRIGVNSENSSDSQALIHLKSMYCDNRRCLSCAIGQELLRKNAKIV
ncbi:MAG: DUF2851 family protein [Flavobacteriales bacterium]|nr:DUF2851 family protein [Flavobacteriales bacterium]